MAYPKIENIRRWGQAADTRFRVSSDHPAAADPFDRLRMTDR
jgi:hypothetical protein